MVLMAGVPRGLRHLYRVDLRTGRCLPARRRPATRVAALTHTRSSLAACGIGSPAAVRTGGVSSQVAWRRVSSQYRFSARQPVWNCSPGWSGPCRWRSRWPRAGPPGRPQASARAIRGKRVFGPALPTCPDEERYMAVRRPLERACGGDW